jgi:hypothetical protein
MREVHQRGGPRRRASHPRIRDATARDEAASIVVTFGGDIGNSDILAASFPI